MSGLDCNTILKNIKMKRQNIGKSPYTPGNKYKISLQKGDVTIEFIQYAGDPPMTTKGEIIFQLIRDVSTVNFAKNVEDWKMMFLDISAKDESYYIYSKQTFDELRILSKKLHVLFSDYEYEILRQKAIH